MIKLDREAFPDDFLFGVATSAYQIEGHAFGDAGRTHWDDFASTPGNVVRAENGARACDHYSRYGDDFDLASAAGFDCYRFSTSWARILPEGKGQPNSKGLDYYDRLTDALLERNLKPCLTLYHWELPSALADLGGWRNRDIAYWFADFTEIIMRRIGDRMFSTATINEPWCVSWLSHFLGQHAPGLRDVRAAARAMHHVLLAHGKSLEVMRGLGLSNLGAVFNLEWSTPADDTVQSQLAAQTYDGIYNHFFLSGVFRKSYPETVLKGLEAHLPNGWDNDFDTIGAPVDWCGLNYYTRSLQSYSPGPWPNSHAIEGPLEKTQMGWEIYPQGLYDFLVQTARDYSGETPIFVTENGMANFDQIEYGKIDDSKRIKYIEDHLDAVLRACAAGVPVLGYFVWSLLDNYEWALGYEKRFGIVHVDFETLKRTPKNSYYALQNFLTT